MGSIMVVTHTFKPTKPIGFLTELTLPISRWRSDARDTFKPIDSPKTLGIVREDKRTGYLLIFKETKLIKIVKRFYLPDLGKDTIYLEAENVLA